MMIEITREPISPELVINKARTDSSGCVVTYVGVIRDKSHGKPVLWVEYEDPEGTAVSGLQEIASEARQKWELNNVAISHRTGRLNVGEINLTVAIASAHRKEGIAACRFIIDRFKQSLPTRKREAYQDGSIRFG